MSDARKIEDCSCPGINLYMLSLAVYHAYIKLIEERSGRGVRPVFEY